MKYWSDKHRTLYNGNCRSMSELANESIQCCVTSPPYWGLRKYAGEQYSIWGGTPDCSHEWVEKIDKNPLDRGGKGQFDGNGRGIGTNMGVEVTMQPLSSGSCSLCGAWRGAYGLEPSPEMYVQHTVEILREIRRVLRKDGVVFWNCDDSYYSSPSNQQGKGVEGSGVGVRGCQDVGRVKLPRHDTLKPKDLCLIPFRVAIAAQEDGWWVRSVIIWSKPNPMPESVTDRPTGSHEYILMLTKSAKYYYDAEAVKEPQQESSIARYRVGDSFDKCGTPGEAYPDEKRIHPHNFSALNLLSLSGRNLRSVWTFPTQGFSDWSQVAHFATYPEKLVEICVKAATKEGDTVLDPFCGSGTTLEVAAKLNRHAVGYEISEEYCRLIVERNNQSVLL